MSNLGEIDFERLWKRLQQVGLNAYEARSYLVLVGHPRFKALELASRAEVPRQKIYEVLDGLVEKGFARVIQEKTKLFSAIEPQLAVPTYVERRRQALEREIEQQNRNASGLIDDLKSIFHDGRGSNGTLDYLQIVNDTNQAATHFRGMLGNATSEYLEFSCPPYAADPAQESLLREAKQRGVRCRLLVLTSPEDAAQRACVSGYVAAGAEVRLAETLPMKLALFDGRQGLIALQDPVVTRQSWTSVMFDHAGMGEAMRGLFESHWSRGAAVDSEAQHASAG